LRKEDTLTDSALLSDLARGTPAALEALINSYFPVLCKFAEKFLPDSSLAKDVVQETFIKFWNAGQHFQSSKALKAYLFTATRNGCLNLVRTRERLENRHQELFGDDPEAADRVHTEIAHMENIALIYQVVRNLPPKMQEIFYLSYEEGLTVGQIAARLNMKLKTVKNHKYKTLMFLRGKFGHSQGGLLLFLALL